MLRFVTICGNRMTKFHKILENAPEGGELQLVRTTISMPWKLYEVAAEAIQHYGHSSFSSLVQDLIRRDRQLRLQDQFRTGIIRRTDNGHDGQKTHATRQ